MASCEDGGLLLDIPEADNIFRFDTSSTHELYAEMSKVDLIAECGDYDIYIEIKDPANPYNQGEDELSKLHNGKWANEVVDQFRETFLYRWGQGIEKTVRYVLLVTEIEQAYLTIFVDKVAAILPREKPTCWHRHYVQQLTAVTLDSFSKVHPTWSVTRV